MKQKTIEFEVKPDADQIRISCNLYDKGSILRPSWTKTGRSIWDKLMKNADKVNGFKVTVRGIK